MTIAAAAIAGGEQAKDGLVDFLSDDDVLVVVAAGFASTIGVGYIIGWLTGTLICADWSASRHGRAAWAADVETGVVSRRQPPTCGWNVTSLLENAGADALVCFDAPIGLPRTFLEAAGAGSFVEWLERAPFEELFEPVTGPDGWSERRPFVRPVAGGWTAVRAIASFELWRTIDRHTGAESAFKLIGAKQVGRAAQELWRELRDARADGVAFRIWPFETELDGEGIVVAEIYPRTAYEEVLGPTRFAKSNAAARRDALTRLEQGVTIVDVEAAAATDHDFDAAVTAVALLRRVLAGRPLAGGRVDPVYEGGILCA